MRIYCWAVRSLSSQFLDSHDSHSPCSTSALASVSDRPASIAWSSAAEQNLLARAKIAHDLATDFWPNWIVQRDALLLLRRDAMEDTGAEALKSKRYQNRFRELLGSELINFSGPTIRF